MSMKTSSFNFKQFCGDKSLMVIVPHEDDEINLAGSSIIAARKENVHVICVFLTNGDWEYPAYIRIREAVNSLKIMGVPDKDVIFLGYPDGGAHAERSVFMAETPRNGQKHNQTYGTEHHPDFAYSAYGKHSEYTWENLLNDLKSVITKYKPGVILATDFDRHPDHRMTSLAFDTVMGEILNQYGNNYLPVVMKGFCYCTGFESIPDYFNRHFLSSVINRAKFQQNGFETENPVYEWRKRIRLPVPEEARTNLRNNLIFEALSAHISQKAIWKHKPEKIINGDQVFWLRRTRNLIYEGKVSASSGNPSYLHDFRMMNTRDINSDNIDFQDYLWITEKDDKQKWCLCEFSSPQHIEAMAFYGNISEGSRILKGRITFSTGYSYDIEGFNIQGHENFYQFVPQDNVTWVKFEILESKGNQAGISEWEILSEKKNIPILQICVDDNLAYEWFIYPGESPTISAYTHDVHGELLWFMDGQSISLDEINKKIGKLSSISKIRVESRDNPSIWSEIVISPASGFYQTKKTASVLFDKAYVWYKKQTQKIPHHQLRKQRNR